MSDGRPTTFSELADEIERTMLHVASARRARGLSLRECARQVGVSFSTLKRAEDGEDLRATTLIAILRWLDQTQPTEP